MSDGTATIIVNGFISKRLRTIENSSQWNCQHTAAAPGGDESAVPFYVWLLLLLQFFAGAYLLLNAIGWPAPPHLAPFALALTVMLFTTGIAYLIALARALQENPG